MTDKSADHTKQDSILQNIDRPAPAPMNSQLAQALQSMLSTKKDEHPNQDPIQEDDQDVDEEESSEKKPDQNKNSDKVLQENIRYARSLSQKISETKKLLDRFVQEGEIEEELAENLKKSLNVKAFKNEESFAESVKEENDHPLCKFMDVIDADLFNTYKEVSDDDHAEQKLRAFDYFTNEASPEELEKIIAEFDGMKSPMNLLKKMLSIGSEFLNDGLNDYFSSGSLRTYIKKETEKRNKLQDKIDSLEKKLKMYEDGKKPSRFRVGSGDQSTQKFSGTPIDFLTKTNMGRSLGR